jgi:hypothetical protein
MPPIRTGDKSGKRTAKPQKHKAGGLVESQAVLGGTGDATKGRSYIEEDMSPEFAETMDSAAE